MDLAVAWQIWNLDQHLEHTMTKALDAAVRFIPTPPAFNEISSTYIEAKISTSGFRESYNDSMPIPTCPFNLLHPKLMHDIPEYCYLQKTALKLSHAAAG